MHPSIVQSYRDLIKERLLYATKDFNNKFIEIFKSVENLSENQFESILRDIDVNINLQTLIENDELVLERREFILASVGPSSEGSLECTVHDGDIYVNNGAWNFSALKVVNPKSYELGFYLHKRNYGGLNEIIYDPPVEIPEIYYSTESIYEAEPEDDWDDIPF